MLGQLRGRDDSKVLSDEGKPIANRDQQYVIDLVAERIPKAEKASEVVALEEMLSLLCRRQTILRRIRKSHYDVYAKRAGLSDIEKMWIVLQALRLRFTGGAPPFPA